MTWLWIALAAVVIIGAAIAGALFGFQLRKPVVIGTLLVITDPVDGSKYMTLEVQKGRTEDIFDGNEVTVKVIERVGKDPRK